MDAISADAWLRLGIASLREGKYAEAVTSLRRSIELNASVAEAWGNLGVALISMRQVADAEAAFRRAAELSPQRADMHCNLGQVLCEQGRYAQAAESLSTSLRLDESNAAARFSLALALRAIGNLNAALVQLQRLLSEQPTHVAALISLSKTFEELGRFEEAIAGYKRAIQLAPTHPDAYTGLGMVLSSLGQHAQSIEAFQRAVELAPNSADVHSNLGHALGLADRDEEALECLRNALKLDPRNPRALLNLGVVLGRRSDLGQAVRCCQAALQLQPDYAVAHHNLGLFYLRQGDWQRGWDEYEWRWQCAEFKQRNFSQPQWDGSPEGGQTLLLICEQGLGDTLLFIRYARLAQQRGQRVVLECPRTLIPILSTCRGIDEFVAVGDPLPPFDRFAPLMSLPRIFGTLPKNTPCEIPYLQAESPRIERWKQELASHREFKVGIAWRGSPKQISDRYRSVSLAQFEPLAKIHGVRLFSLQKGVGAEELEFFNERFGIVDLGAGLDADGAFLDTAAVMKNLDLVISVDSAPAHLAGALGVSVWLALNISADWRWLLDREDSPWYPTARLFRQTRRRDWNFVFREMAAALDKRLNPSTML